jgi:mono/diheme cytochrome c family protein
MLARLDRVVAAVSWVAAAVVVLMLLIGPRLIAEDEPTPASAETGGQAVFVANCGSCHTLSAAGTSGQVGPSLDGIALGAADVEAIVQSGRGIMPAFGGELSASEISAVAEFVAGSG